MRRKLTLGSAPGASRATTSRRPSLTLKQIMEMGQWKSRAIEAYLDMDEIEAEALVEAHIQESGSDDELFVDGVVAQEHDMLGLNN